ncbi:MULTISPECIES: glucosyl-3-phosphoglycerate synthase [Streptomyces]|uniref:glucosyl-3-phosphoglycerate synthase n=1 Tax=Streptomyces TaxID=1883 RepID=UPI00103B60CE|nr:MULTISPECIES: glucosyl-3-phosphoglycerate synthase [Streptomyces]MBT3076533.1 glucosyl-3-phosphoglycerate synthase [Streptomyces sp. COG21]MBT3078953.1 glucosyl-3-phosphoglycerate synthase [Streptomyces sp. COG20]MBT3087822.1 glucosyl-3-phosphoglycerate synthase [Streptomyces sp. CYG21]MBT3107180.1 glucosyl-3-phosphoglycerate synthase [Streptomyces sp. COG19]MBT3109229.1 glucosyl-3-phosphoglycerate synthase [Streptomyces sp. CYG20]
MLEEVERWLTRRSWSSADRPLDRLLDARTAEPHRTSVSVVLPALNEEATVGAIVATIRRELMEKVRLVDELVVIDSGSTDATATVAHEAGARVVHRDAILPRIPALPGKGEVLWRSLLVTSGEIVCFVDADLKDFSADFVSGTVGPLLTDPTVHFVKAMYDRPLGDTAGQGGRVTELVARPLLNLHWPQLAGFVQPLGGEYAVRRSLLERLPFPVGYGVELGLLVDALHTVGLDALGQVDVGVRRHRHQDGQALGRMAAAIYRTAQLRLSRGHLVRPALTQFERGAEGFVPRTHAVDTEERPPMREIAEYAERWAA